MPYIPKEQRGNWPPKTRGEVNYHMTKAMNDYLVRNGVSYQTISEALDLPLRISKDVLLAQTDDVLTYEDTQAAFRDAQMEFYRRIAIPYEDKKLKENGDVYSREVMKQVE